MKDLGLKFSIPIFFFEGTEDFTTPTELARKYLEEIQAPQKEFVPISGGHFAVFMNRISFLSNSSRTFCRLPRVIESSLSDREERFAASLYTLISDKGVHPLIAEQEYARLFRNVVIEYGLMFVTALQKKGVTIQA